MRLEKPDKIKKSLFDRVICSLVIAKNVKVDVANKLKKSLSVYKKSAKF